MLGVGVTDHAQCMQQSCATRSRHAGALLRQLAHVRLGDRQQRLQICRNIRARRCQEEAG